MAAAARQDSAEQSGSEAGWEMVKDSQSWGQPGAGLRGPGSTGNGRWEQLRAQWGQEEGAHLCGQQPPRALSPWASCLPISLSKPVSR